MSAAMTTEQSLQTGLTADAAATETDALRFVHLTQPVESGMDKTASMYDLAQMVARARSRQSAHTYKKNQCPAGVTGSGVNVRLDFFAWPSFPTLAYTLSSSFGEVSPAAIIEEYTEFSIVFGMTDAVELDFILKDIVFATWEKAECYDKDWRPIVQEEQPAIIMDGLTTLRTETGRKVFGVARIRGRKVGAQHRLTAKLIKSYPTRPDEPLPEEGISSEDLETYWQYSDVATWNGNPVDGSDTADMTGLRIENLNITVTARWINAKGEEETEAMRLDIPQCVKDLLSTCGNLEQFGGDTSMCDQSDNPEHLTVYGSGCTGDVLEERRTKDDPDSWCE